MLAGTVNVTATQPSWMEAGLRMPCSGAAARSGASRATAKCRCSTAACSTTYFFIGTRYLRLAEGLQINENLTSLLPANPGSFAIFDQFNTENTFSGLDLGGTWTFQQNRWSIEVMPRLALGGTRQEVRIDGSTRATVGGVLRPAAAGGLLTQSSNIGVWDRTIMSFVPEIDLTLGYQISPRLRLIGGYTLLAWTGVARPGDQIDTAVNPNLIPLSGLPVSGPLQSRIQLSQPPRCWCRASTSGLDLRLVDPRLDPLNFHFDKERNPFHGTETVETDVVRLQIPSLDRSGSAAAI